MSFNDAVRQRQHLAFSKDVGATFIGERSQESLELNPDGTVFGVGVGYLSPLDNGAVAKITGVFLVRWSLIYCLLLVGWVSVVMVRLCVMCSG